MSSVAATEPLLRNLNLSFSTGCVRDLRSVCMLTTINSSRLEGNAVLSPGKGRVAARARKNVDFMARKSNSFVLTSSQNYYLITAVETPQQPNPIVPFPTTNGDTERESQGYIIGAEEIVSGKFKP